MSAIAPLPLNCLAWWALLAYWLIAAFFAYRPKIKEPLLARLQHIIPIGLAFYLIFTARLLPPHHKLYHTNWNNWITYPATLLTLIGLAICVWARIHLGRYWSGAITLKPNHKIIDTGPYHFVRHPIYTGWLTAMLGSAITAATTDAFLGFTIVTLALMLKARREEKLLTTTLGQQYHQYKNQVPAAILPRILPTHKT